MGSKEKQIVMLLQILYIILTLPIYVTLFTSPENTLGSEPCLFLTQSSTRRLCSRFAFQILDLTHLLVSKYSNIWTLIILK